MSLSVAAAMVFVSQDIIHNPMDLRTMKSKCTKNEYDNKEEFLEDVALMRTNCETYNGPASELSDCVRMVEEDIKGLLASDTYRQRIEESEAAIEQHQLLTRLDVCISQLALLPNAKIFAKTPDWPEYVQKVETPLGLDTLRERVEAKLYSTAGEFMWDVQQMWENSVVYNGKDSYYTQLAEGMINRAREYLVKWYTRLQLEPSDSLVQRLKKEKELAGIAGLAGRSSTATPGTSTPALSYHPSSRTPKHATGAAATPGPTLLPSPARSPVLVSPRLQISGVEGTGTAPSPRMSPSSLAPDSPAMLATPQISAGETVNAGRSVLRTPALSSSIASPLLTIPSTTSSPSAATRQLRTGVEPSPFSTAHLPAFTPTAASSSSSPTASSTTAFLPSSSSPSVHRGNGAGGAAMGGVSAVDEHDVLSGFGDMDAVFGVSDDAAGAGDGVGGLEGDGGVGMGGGGVGDMELGLSGLGGLGEEDGMALEDLPPPMEDDGEKKEDEDEINIWN